MLFSRLLCFFNSHSWRLKCNTPHDCFAYFCRWVTTVRVPAAFQFSSFTSITKPIPTYYGSTITPIKNPLCRRMFDLWRLRKQQRMGGHQLPCGTLHEQEKRLRYLFGWKLWCLDKKGGWPFEELPFEIDTIAGREVGGKPDAAKLLLQTMPLVQKHFLTNINLGNR